MPNPDRVELIGTEVAILWDDGLETYFPMDVLRAASPSAENQGERDLFGNLYGGTAQRDFPGVEVTGWQPVGGYALQFTFSDGHRTGIYSFKYLRELWDAIEEQSKGDA